MCQSPVIQRIRDKRRSSLFGDNENDHVTMNMFPQYDLTKEVRFELMKKVFGSVHLHKRHTFLNKDTEREFRAHDRHKKMMETEFVRQKQKVEEHFQKLVSSTQIPKDDLRYSYNNWPPSNPPSKAVNKQQPLEKAKLECTVVCKDGKETYIPAKSNKEMPVKKKKSHSLQRTSTITKFPLYRQFTM